MILYHAALTNGNPNGNINW